MGVYRRRMEERRRREETRRRQTQLIMWLAVAVVLFGGVVSAAVILQQQRLLEQQQRAKVSTTVAVPDLFAGLTPLTEAEERAGWIERPKTSTKMVHWLRMDDAELAAALVHELAVARPDFLQAHSGLRNFNWVSRLQIPAPKVQVVGRRRAVIVGQLHPIFSSHPKSVEMPEETVVSQREIYRFLLRQATVQPDMTLLHEGVTSAYPITARNVSILAPYLASVQFVLHHPAVEQLPGEDVELRALDMALDDTPAPGMSLDDYPPHRQAIVEMRSRTMAREMALVLNRGRTPLLTVGDAHEAGILTALKEVGYRVAIWQSEVLRRPAPAR